MRDIALRNGTLDRNTVTVCETVRIFRETHAISAMSNSTTTGYEEKRLEMERWKILHCVKDLGMGNANYIIIQIDKTLVHKLFSDSAHSRKITTLIESTSILNWNISTH